MSETDFKFTVGSDVDFEDLIGDVTCDNNLLLLLTQEAGFENLRIQIYPPPNGVNYWEFRLDEFEGIIQKVKDRLWDLRKNDRDGSNYFSDQ